MDAGLARAALMLVLAGAGIMGCARVGPAPPAPRWVEPRPGADATVAAGQARRPLALPVPGRAARPTANLMVDYRPSAAALQAGQRLGTVPLAFPEDEQVLLRQLREAAQEEADPELRARLWQELQGLLRRDSMEDDTT